MMVSIHRNTASILFFLLSFALLLVSAGCARKTLPETIVFAISQQPLSAPVYVAYDQGYFLREGLDVKLTSFWVGKDALESVVRGQAQFATVAETPLVFAGFDGKDFLILASIADSSRYAEVVARKDRRITVPEDLAGRRVGVTPGTTSEYYMDLFRRYYTIPKERITFVPLKQESMNDALERGEIDAASTWKPHSSFQKRALGGRAAVFTNRSLYKIWWNIAGNGRFVRAHPETAVKVLRALARAEEFLRKKPREATSIAARYVGDPTLSLADFNYELQLGQTLLLELEDQARWAIRAKLVTSEGVPNFLSFMYTDAIRAAAPGAVLLVHE